MAAADVLESPPIPATVADASRILESEYQIAGDIRPLPGERDRNFRVAGESGSYVLKIANPAERPGVLDMQQKALRHLHRWDPALPVPRPIPTEDGALVGQVEVAGLRVGVKLATYLGGATLDEVAPSPQLRRNAIETLAALGMALRTFNHPELDRPLAWDLRRLLELRPRTAHLESERKTLCEHWLGRFEADVAAALQSFTTQAIHNDFNPANLLVDPAAPERVTGVLDFGDMTRGNRVVDLAVAVAYQCFSADDPASVIPEAAATYAEGAFIPRAAMSLLPDLVVARLVQSLIISGWRASLHAENRDYILIHAEPVWQALQRLTALGVDELRDVVMEAVTEDPGPQPSQAAALELRQRRLAPGLRLTYTEPIHAVSAESVWITDARGVRYLDAYNNVPHVGHGHPAVVAALADQAYRLNTNTRYLIDGVNTYADRLASLLPDPLEVVFFANSGGEANDLAWRIARTVTGRRGMVVTEHAYHGSTYLTMATSPEELGLQNLEPWVATVPPPRPGATTDGLHEALARLEQGDVEPAAFACDTVFSSDGIYEPPDGYLAATYAAIRSAGGLCIADEVQAGLGRVGTRFWGFAADPVVPDIVTLGKPLGNGHPLAAVVATRAIADAFSESGYYFSTFAGNPVSAAVGMAVLDVTEQERLPEQAEVVGSYLRRGLGALADRHSIIADVRGPGLFVGVELVTADGQPAGRQAEAIQNRMRDRGVLIGRTGPQGNVLKIRPPLVFTEEHADLLLDRLSEILGENL
ncbi:MAG: aminotransferase class III-fold pyridoxal phosphate-dependent enzyme [Acidimicrobiia bacterium]|nr:aminotransferase class III-fold pyridoxal phosphate-dependent enzyme [Acidimicrobiia bacterium]